MTDIAYPRYSREKSDASISVLLRLASELETPHGGYRLIGGLATQLLCREHSQLGPHVGTFDVDLALAPGVLPKQPTLGERFDRLGLRPDHGDRRSMYWFADLGNKQSVPIDLVAPRLSEQSPPEMDVSGIRAWCPPGTGAILESPVEVARDGTAWGGVEVHGVNIVVASGPAIIMAKSRSFQDRAHGQGREVDLPKAGKHAYDLFYLMTSCRTGPAALAKEWKSMAHHLLKRKTLEILTDGFSSKTSLGPRLAAGFIRANLGDAAGIEEMVVEQVRVFVDSVR